MSNIIGAALLGASASILASLVIVLWTIAQEPSVELAAKVLVKFITIQAVVAAFSGAVGCAVWGY